MVKTLSTLGIEVVADCFFPKMTIALFLFPHALPELAGLCDYPVE